MKSKNITKQFKQIKWTTEHTLMPDQLEKLIKDKFERAERLHQQQQQFQKKSQHNPILSRAIITVVDQNWDHCYNRNKLRN